MECSECRRVVTLPQCLDTIIVGTIAALNTDVIVYMLNQASGYQYSFEATSSGVGLVTIDISDYTESFITGVDFELWVTLATEPSTSKLDVTIGSCAYDCYLLRFGGFCFGTEATLAPEEACV